MLELANVLRIGFIGGTIHLIKFLIQINLQVIPFLSQLIELLFLFHQKPVFLVPSLAHFKHLFPGLLNLLLYEGIVLSQPRQFLTTLILSARLFAQIYQII